MTGPQKKVISLLLQGHFLIWSKPRRCYTLYDHKMNPLVRIREKTVASIDSFVDPKLKLWKIDKNGRMTLNLSTVRRLHGRSTIKKMYKNRTAVFQDARIYKQKQRKAKKQNEKVYNLF